MNTDKRKYLMQTALLTVLTAVAGTWAGTSFFPGQCFAAFPAIPAFFFLLGWGAMEAESRLSRRSPRQALQYYLLMRVLRMILCLMAMVVYAVLVPEGRAAFLLTFIAVYLIYLIYDSWHFSTQVRRNRKSPEQDEASV